MAVPHIQWRRRYSAVDTINTEHVQNAHNVLTFLKLKRLGEKVSKKEPPRVITLAPKKCVFFFFFGENPISCPVLRQRKWVIIRPNPEFFFFSYKENPVNQTLPPTVW